MRVVVDGLIFRTTPYGGIARYWSELFRSVQQANLDLKYGVVLPQKSHLPSCANLYRSGSPLSYLAALRAELFHSTYYTSWPRIRCPTVVTVYDFVDALLPQIRAHNARFVVRQRALIQEAQAVVVISEMTRENLVQMTGIERERIFLAYPGVPTLFAMPLPTTEQIVEFRQLQTGGAPYIMHVGVREGYKNFKTILNAFIRIAAKSERHLIIVGSNPRLDDDIVDSLIANRLLGRVHFLSVVDDQTLRLLYAGADALVSASIMEGFGIPLIEALASGTGLILSDIPVYREVAGAMATFVDPVAVEAWEEALLQPVAVDSGWRDIVLRRFSWSATASAHLEAYRYALRGS